LVTELAGGIASDMQVSTVLWQCNKLWGERKQHDRSGLKKQD
jgi:hypothetical protein